MSKRAFCRIWVLALFSAVGLFPTTALSAVYDLDDLAEAASGSGWGTAWDADGSLFLYPGSFQQPDSQIAALSTGPEPEPEAEPQPQPDPLGDLEQRLVETGWDVSRDTDGSLLLYPRSSTHADTVAATRQETENAETASQQTPDPLGQLARVLSDRGWRTDRDGDGNLLLYFG